VRRPAVAVLVIAAALAGGCGTSSTVSSGPTPVKCQVSVAAPGMLDAAGGNSSVSVTALPECAWTASTTTAWLTELSPASGQGNGSVSFRVAANDTDSARDGSIVVNDETVRVSQRAACRYTLVPASQTVAAGGGASSITVTTSDAECAWTARADESWISLTETTSGTGSGTISFTASPNAGDERTAAIIVAGQRATVTQSGAAAPPVNCSISIAPASQQFAAGGGTGSIAVNAQGVCEWSARAGVPWVTITSPAGGTGNGTVTFTVAQNTGAARTGTITVANRTFTVTQAAAPCSYSISPQTQNAGASGGTGSVSVTTAAGCAWTASSNAPWLTVTGGATGTGNGTVSFAVAANTGAARTGTLTIATQTFTVTQSTGVAPCSYSISPSSQNVGASASTVTVNVTTAAACAWTATEGVPWITIASGASDTGNGTVNLSIAANTGAARSGTVTIAGESFTVNQAAFVPACSYSISPSSQNVGAGASTVTVNVTTAAACAWTATEGVPWITIASGASDTGNGTVNLSIAANTGGARSGTVTIAGQSFTVNQAAFVPPCTFSIAPSNQNVPAPGGTGTVTVTTASGCTWTASSNAPWLSITSGASGTGNGSVGFSAAANSGGSRTGTLTIAGQTFTVTQAAAAGPSPSLNR